MRHFAILGLLMHALSAAAGAGALVVVTHPDFPAGDIRVDDLSRVFLGQTQRLGSAALNPVNKEAGSPDRTLFDQKVHHMDDAAMKDYWLAARIKGEGHPPRSFQSDAAVLRYVSSVPGGIGYVAYPLTGAGVRALTVNGAAPAEGSYPLRGP
ncbi:MAG: hypothetical protein HY303_15900 [Candidatus Wallbacteria bacterium]|nr:hypothetical protein [Candidatus Wallbacteria bacterium]